MLALVGSETSFDHGRELTAVDQALQSWILRHQPKLDGGKIEKLARRLRGIDGLPRSQTPSESRPLTLTPATQTVRHVLDWQQRKCHHRPPLLPHSFYFYIAHPLATHAGYAPRVPGYDSEDVSENDRFGRRGCGGITGRLRHQHNGTGWQQTRDDDRCFAFRLSCGPTEGRGIACARQFQRTG